MGELMFLAAVFASGWTCGVAWRRGKDWRQRRRSRRAAGFPRLPRRPQAVRREVSHV
ncbi:MAG TPA: hypothetical protein VIG88_14005 [Lysobacter sp.]